VDLNEIKETFSLFSDWESKYRYIIEIGKDIPEMSSEEKTEQNLIRGCQSQVWLVHRVSTDGQIDFKIDSDAHIVRGLIAIILSALNSKPPAEIINFDVADLFSGLELMEHLSPTRGNGLRSMVEKIQSVANRSMQS
jgi:cysteine desulfuration protein SufE